MLPKSLYLVVMPVKAEMRCLFFGPTITIEGWPPAVHASLMADFRIASVIVRRLEDEPSVAAVTVPAAV